MGASTSVALETGNSTPRHYTGILCKSCREPVAVLVESTPQTVALQCPACGYSWADPPAVTVGALAARPV